MYHLFFAFVVLIYPIDCAPRHRTRCFFPPTKHSYNPGDKWTYDKCIKCECFANGMQCHIRVCQVPRCSKELRESDGCCEVCTNCYDEDRKRVVSPGESFASKDGCMLCECKRGGSLTCVSKKCPPLLCHESMVESGPGCCPVCRQGCYDNKYGHGEMANNTTFDTPDGCKTCTCLSDGAIRCTAKPCPDIPCPPELQADPEPGKCCPTCKPGCYDSEHGHGVVQPGTTFDTTDGCMVCTCHDNGAIDCLGKSCKMPCHQALWLPVEEGQCCPTCKEGCYDDEYGLKEIGVNETKSTDDNCTKCSCRKDGTLLCDDTLLPGCTDD